MMTPNRLHMRIMNLTSARGDAFHKPDERESYKLGHRDARHAAAELAGHAADIAGLRLTAIDGTSAMTICKRALRRLEGLRVDGEGQVTYGTMLAAEALDDDVEALSCLIGVLERMEQQEREVAEA